MAWVKVDDGFPEHPKVIDLDLAALGLWLAGLCYANRQLTDGTLPAGFVRRAGPDAPTAAAQLVAAGLWDEDAAGFRIHDYLEHQRSREQIASTAAKRAEAGRIGGQANPKQNASKPEATGEQTGSQTQPEQEEELEEEKEPEKTTPSASVETPKPPSRARSRTANSGADAPADGSDASDDKPPAASAPYRLFQALCASSGADESAVAPAYKKKQLSVAKRLLADYRETDVLACINFVQSQTWRSVPSDLFTVEKEIGKWALAGKPSRDRPRTSATNAGGTGQVVL